MEAMGELLLTFVDTDGIHVQGITKSLNCIHI